MNGHTTSAILKRHNINRKPMYFIPEPEINGHYQGKCRGKECKGMEWRTDKSSDRKTFCPKCGEIIYWVLRET